MRVFISLIAVATFASTSAWALDDPQTPLADPFESGMWSYHQVTLLGDPKNIQFDDRVRVLGPAHAEDSFHVPVLVDATAVPNVKRILMSVDYGPIPKILTYYPGQAEAKLSFRFKIDQATPIRAAVETHDGTWHIGGVEVDAAGGGCAAPAVAYAMNDWEERLGEVRGKIWPHTGRLRMIVDHPMDTGLADGIPVFIVETLEVQSMEGQEMARIELYEPVNEDPTFTLHFPKGTLDQQVRVVGRDNNGNGIHAVLKGDLNLW